MRGAQAFWRDKVELAPDAFKVLADEAKSRAFAVSGIAKGDELHTVFTALQKAIDDGTDFKQFQEDCEEVFARRGWTGKTPWRVAGIFQTNIQTAYNVGRYDQLQQEKDILPYWMYDAINDAVTRPSHREMDGRVYPANDPIWHTWYPPNGYG
jgi:SPP1 gp7 family putative phage head morphogenesis protein